VFREWRTIVFLSGHTGQLTLLFCYFCTVALMCHMPHVAPMTYMLNVGHVCEAIPMKHRTYGDEGEP
jgi:hypothetical protein